MEASVKEDKQPPGRNTVDMDRQKKHERTKVESAFASS